MTKTKRNPLFYLGMSIWLLILAGPAALGAFLFISTPLVQLFFGKEVANHWWDSIVKLIP